MMAYIEKKRPQIELRLRDTKSQLVFWRRSLAEHLNRGTYGTRSPPYLANKCLETLVRKGQASHAYVTQAILQTQHV